LAKPFKPNKEYIVEPKFDGVRLVTHLNKDGSFEMFSRSGLRYDYFQVACKGEIEKLYQSLSKLGTEEKDFVIDGEMISSDQNFGSVVALGHSMNIAKEIPLQYHVFDLIFRSDYDDKGTKLPHLERKKILEKAIPNTNTEVPGQNVTIARVPYFIESFANKGKVNKLVDEYKSKGYEGIMLKDPQGLHLRKRHIGIIKAKTNDSYDLKITGFNVEKGALTQLVLSSANNKTVRVGNGIPDAVKAHILQNQEKFLGKIVEVTASSVSGNSLRFPVFLKFREDKSVPDSF